MRYLTLFLIAIAIGGCGPAPPEGMELAALDPSGIVLPDEYLVKEQFGDNRHPAKAMWSLDIVAQPTTNTCGEEVMWAWSDGPSSPAVLGDPAIRLFVCDAGTVAGAQDNLAAVAIEQTVVPQLEGIYRPVQAPINHLSLAAESAQLACVWGELVRCRAWAYAAAYGRYVVNAHFVMAASDGGLSGADFEELVVAIDQWIAASVTD